MLVQQTFSRFNTPSCVPVDVLLWDLRVDRAARVIPINDKRSLLLGFGNCRTRPEVRNFFEDTDDLFCSPLASPVKVHRPSYQKRKLLICTPSKIRKDAESFLLEIGVVYVKMDHTTLKRTAC